MSLTKVALDQRVKHRTQGWPCEMDYTNTMGELSSVNCPSDLTRKVSSIGWYVSKI